MSIASKLVLSVALAGFALPALAQGSATTASSDQSNVKPAIHQSAPVTSGAKTVSSAQPVKAAPAKAEVVNASTTKPVSTTTAAPVTKAN
jgi:hypothetical protein